VFVHKRRVFSTLASVRPWITPISFLVLTNVIRVANAARLLAALQHITRIPLTFTLLSPLCASAVRFHAILIVSAKSATLAAVLPHPTGVGHAVPVQCPSRAVLFLVFALGFFIGANETGARAVDLHEFLVLTITLTQCFPVRTILLPIVASIGIDGRSERSASAASLFTLLQHEIGIIVASPVFGPSLALFGLVSALGFGPRQACVAGFAAEHSHPLWVKKALFAGGPDGAISRGVDAFVGAAVAGIGAMLGHILGKLHAVARRLPIAASLVLVHASGITAHFARLPAIGMHEAGVLVAFVEHRPWGAVAMKVDADLVAGFAADRTVG